MKNLKAVLLVLVGLGLIGLIVSGGLWTSYAYNTGYFSPVNEIKIGNTNRNITNTDEFEFKLYKKGNDPQQDNKIYVNGNVVDKINDKYTLKIPWGQSKLKILAKNIWEKTSNTIET